MCKVSKISKKMNHHPEWININKIVIITLITHDKGGITNKDIELAYNIDQLS
jgi:4a-hydroxytetrahydrobiopterin dehydratase